jgi:hypothetical protein
MNLTAPSTFRSMDDAWKMPPGVPPHEASVTSKSRRSPMRVAHAIFYGIGEERTALIRRCQASESIHEST